jgi:hypothetical protein
LTFFGLSEEYIQNVYEEMFLLKYHGGWSLFELYNLPITLRRWFLQRLNEEIERQNEQIEKAYKSK